MGVAGVRVFLKILMRITRKGMRNRKFIWCGLKIV